MKIPFGIAQNRGTGKISFKIFTKGGVCYMGDTVKELPRFFSTEDVRKILKIGNKACL